MWQFAQYQRKEITVPTAATMAIKTGLEARYADRFRAYAGTNDDTIKQVDEAKKTTESLRLASGIVDTQKENIKELFTQAEMMVKLVNDFQRNSGVKQVKNIPLPGASIKASPGKQLGYVKLCMNFISAGMLHFMEMTLQMKDDLDSRDQVIKMIAEHRAEVQTLGSIIDVELDELSSEDPIVETKEPLVTDDDDDITELSSSGAQIGVIPPVTPPKTPVQKGGKIKPSSPTTKKPTSK